MDKLPIMKSLESLNKYLKQHQTPTSSDTITRDLVVEYYDNLALKEKWKHTLNKDHQFSLEQKEDIPDQFTKSIKTKKVNIIIFIGFVILSLVLATKLFFPSMETKESQLQALLGDHYANPVPRELMKGSEDVSVLASKAYAFYQSKEYEKAIPLFEKVVTAVPLDEEHLFYLGLSYLYNDQGDMAIDQFDLILKQEKSNRADAATWYLALALTDAEEYDRAKIYLSEVAEWKGNSGKLMMASEAKKLLNLIQTK